MSNQYLKLRRSNIPDRIPTTSSLEFGEIALNTYDGVAYMKKSGSNGEEVVPIGSSTGSFTGNFTGTFTGSLEGTASWAINATSASYLINAKEFYYTGSAPSGSYLTTGSLWIDSDTGYLFAYIDDGSDKVWIQPTIEGAQGIQGVQGPSGSQGSTGSFAITGSNTFKGNQTISGSLNVSGSVRFAGVSQGSQANILTYDTASGQLFFTASSAIGGVPTLQQVTTAGSSSTNPIYIDRLFGGSALSKIDNDGHIYAQSFDIFTGTDVENIINSVQIGVFGLTDNRSLTVPDASGMLVLTVNGVSADASGSITIPTTGTPGGSDTEIQFNSGNTFLGSTSFRFIYASQSLEQGVSAKAIGNYSHAEGVDTQAIGECSHAEGDATQAIGFASHAEGAVTITLGNGSHAEGGSTQTGVTFAYSASISSSTVTLSASYGDVANYFGSVGYPNLYAYRVSNQQLYNYTISSSIFNGTNTVIRIYENTAFNNVVFYVGDIELLRPDVQGSWNGDQTIPGVGSHAEGGYTITLGTRSHAEGVGAQALGIYSHAEGQNTQAIGQGSHAEGYSTQAIGDYSHAEGGSNTKTIGNYSHAEGNQSFSIGNYSHAEGYQTQTIGENSHAEGGNTQAIGHASHAEGNYTIASGSYSHAEGQETQAIGNASHTAGWNTIASGAYQSVIGQYNISSSAQSAFIIGNGIDISSRRNLLFAQGNTVQITGSLDVSGSGRFTNGLTVTGSLNAPNITGSLFGTSSWAVSASWAPSSLLSTTFISTGSVTASVSTATGSIFSVNSGSAPLMRLNTSGSLILSSSIIAARNITIDPTNGTISGFGLSLEAASSVIRIRTNSNNSLLLSTNGLDRWYIDGAGDLSTATDGVHDIGKVATNRPRNAYFTGTINAGRGVFTSSLHITGPFSHVTTASVQTQVNSIVTQFDSNGGSSGYSGGYDFRVGANLGPTTSSFRIWKGGPISRIGIGDGLTESQIQNATTSHVWIKSNISGSIRNAGIRITPSNTNTQVEYNGIQLDFADTGLEGGAFIGSQWNPGTNGYDSDLVILATSASANSYGEIARFVGKSRSVSIGSSPSKNPIATLDVSGSGRFTNGLTVTGSITATTDYIRVIKGSGQIRLGHNGSENMISSTNATETATAPLYFYGNGVDFMNQAITSVGNLTMTGSLNVSGSFNVTNAIRTFTSTGNTFLGSTPVDGGIKLEVNGTSRFRDTVTVYNNKYIQFNYTGESTGFAIKQDTSNRLVIDNGNYAYNALSIKDAPAVSSSFGLVGIFTLNPTATLDVSGSGRFTNGLTVTGSATITNVLNIQPSNPLPVGTTGSLATSGSLLYFHDGTSWRQVSLV